VSNAFDSTLTECSTGFFGDALRRVQLWDYEGTANVQLVTESTQKPEQLHARVLRGGETYLVLMFASARRGDPCL
jgi:hypothetical protein